MACKLQVVSCMLVSRELSLLAAQSCMHTQLGITTRAYQGSGLAVQAIAIIKPASQRLNHCIAQNPQRPYDWTSIRDICTKCTMLGAHDIYSSPPGTSLLSALRSSLYGCQSCVSHPKLTDHQTFNLRPGQQVRGTAPRALVPRPFCFLLLQ
eukprot:1157257-Pelagomonas_calceolata.AAC.5